MTDSPFNPLIQNTSVEAKIVAALERLGEVFRVLLWQKSRETGLSPIQLQMLLFLASHPPEQGKVSYLAGEFNLTKATISDAVRVLVTKGLLERVGDTTDNRSHTLRLSDAGRAVVAATGGFANELVLLVSQFTDARKTELYQSLFALIDQLHRQGVITTQRMCTSCVHYRYDGTLHFCGLLQIPLEATLLRLDCPEHRDRKVGT